MINIYFPNSVSEEYTEYFEEHKAGASPQPWRKRERAENSHEQLLMKGMGLERGCILGLAYLKTTTYRCITNSYLLPGLQCFNTCVRPGLFHYEEFTVLICNEKNKGNVVSYQNITLFQLLNFKIMTFLSFC